MSFLKKLFGKKEEPITSYADFWNWFQKNEKDFHDIVKNRKDGIEKRFFDKLSNKLEQIKDGYYYMVGMYDTNTAELVLTADGDTKNIVFVEELVASAPQIEGWKFTALKPALDINDVSIRMGGYAFTSENLSFYANEQAAYPDEIDVTIVHNDLTAENEQLIANGTNIFLDNYLGELGFLNNIDNLTIIGKQPAQKDLVPIAKLKDFLIWRQKEFVEKYEVVHYDLENSTYSILEAELESGNNLIAVINTDLLNWDSKASHPWIAVLTVKFDGTNNNGMPNSADYELLDTIEDEVTQELTNIAGFLYIGRQTAEGERDLYFACKDFRLPSKVFFKIQQRHSGHFKMEYNIYKDKYWQSFERFNNA